MNVAIIIWLVFTPVFAWIDWRDSRDHVHFEPNPVYVSLFFGSFWALIVVSVFFAWAWERFVNGREL